MKQKDNFKYTKQNNIMENKSALVLFYEGTGKDHQGRSLNDILNFDDKMFDACHDFIQWLFPLHEDSRMTNAQVPLITEEESDYFKSSHDCQSNILLALVRYSQFLDNLGVDKWCVNMDHNLLRITRIIRSLRFFGLEEEAKGFHQHLFNIAASRGISLTTLNYWERARFEPLFNTLY